MNDPNVFRFLSVVIFLFLGIAYGYAAEVGTVTRLEGQAGVIRDTVPARPLQLGEAIFEGDILHTESNSALVVTMNDGSRLTLAEHTRSEITQYVTGTEPAGLIEVTRGRLRAFITDLFSSRRDSFKVRTTTAVVGVQGTDFVLIVFELLTRVIVYEGILNALNVDPNVVGSQLVRQNQTTVIRQGQPPEPPQPLGSSPATLGPGALTVTGLATGAAVIFTPLAVRSLSGSDGVSTVTPSMPPAVQP